MGIESPSTLICPAVGCSKPVNTRIVVDLPQPFGPKKP
ncbi:Uncharacterised protein [Vibrio cholerae]|nr:Uncharacterised protein [Vibrio cholerae]